MGIVGIPGLAGGLVAIRMGITGENQVYVRMTDLRLHTLEEAEKLDSAA